MREGLRVKTATLTQFFVDNSSHLIEEETSDMSGPLPKSFSVCAMRTVWICPRYENVSTVATNSNKTTLEADSHADTTCVGGGTLKLFDYDCPVNVQGYDPTLGVK